MRVCIIKELYLHDFATMSTEVDLILNSVWLTFRFRMTSVFLYALSRFPKPYTVMYIFTVCGGKYVGNRVFILAFIRGFTFRLIWLGASCNLMRLIFLWVYFTLA